MPMIYSTSAREHDAHALPDVWITEMTAHEIAAWSAEGMEDAQWEMRKRFPLAGMNGRDTEAMLEAIVEEYGITGGWCWCYCVPGCMPDSSWFGPFATYADAVADAREQSAE